MFSLSQIKKITALGFNSKKSERQAFGGLGGVFETPLATESARFRWLTDNFLWALSHRKGFLMRIKKLETIFIQRARERVLEQASEHPHHVNIHHHRLSGLNGQQSMHISYERG